LGRAEKENDLFRSRTNGSGKDNVKHSSTSELGRTAVNLEEPSPPGEVKWKTGMKVIIERGRTGANR